MPSFRLILRNRPDKNGLCEIALVYQNDQEETYFPTGRKINPKFWEQKSVNNWVTTDYGSARTTFNLLLKKKKNDAEEKMNKYYLTNDRYPNRVEMKLLLSGNETENKSFFAMFDLFMAHRKSTVTAGTYRNYKKVKERFVKYQEHYHIQFGFHSINHGFHTHFTNYLIKEHESKVNTIGSYFRILKAFLHWAEIHHGIQIDKAVMTSMHVLMEQNFYVWLTKEEIDHLASLDFGEHKPLLSRSRDAFVLQCSLGCRYGDLQRTMTENIISVKKMLLANQSPDKRQAHISTYMFQIKSRKNKKLIQVPLSRRAIAILDKYKGINAADWIPSLNDCNLQIKEVCKLAGFYEVVQVVRGSGDNRAEMRFQKWQLITTHSARRSFINTMLADGISDHVIAAMTGQTIQTIQGYKHADTRDIMKAISVWDRPAPKLTEPGQPST